VYRKEWRKQQSFIKELNLEVYYAKMAAGQFGIPWELIFLSILIAVIPLNIVFLSLQKYFIKGW
jgi:raffinose/stachyose/melibiose transport system permease protein